MDQWSVKEIKVILVAGGLFILLPLYISETGVLWTLTISSGALWLYYKHKKKGGPDGREKNGDGQKDDRDVL